MNRLIFPRYAVSVLVYAFFTGLSPQIWGQPALPPVIPVNVPNFTIPFEVGDGATAIREVELLVSKDRGRRWQSVARQPVESGKFAFRADSDGEYWFTFRMATSPGNAAPVSGHPQLRVLVNTANLAVELPSRQSDTGPLVPPKPEKFQKGNVQRPQPMPLTEENETKAEELPKFSESKPSEPKHVRTVSAEESAQFLAPKLPGFEFPKPATNWEGDLLEDVLRGMNSFLDVHPVIARGTPNNQNNQYNQYKPTPSTSNVPLSSADAPVGSITGIALDAPKEEHPKIIVRWSTGNELWQDAHIDVLRSGAKEGQRVPIAINLSNSGEYWWYLSPEDMKPFYITVRIRSLYGGIREDVTQSEIKIDSRL